MLTSTPKETRFAIQSAGTTLASALTILSPTAPLLVFAHGFAGNKNENGLFTEARDYFTRNGFSVLRFDFRGCGENTQTFSNVRLHDLVSDLEAVFLYIKSDNSLRTVPIGLIGFSLGAGLALLAGIPVDSYVFWSPAIYTRTDMVPRYEPELTEKGYIVKGSTRVSKEFIADLDSDSIPNSLSGLSTPVLLIHGSADQRIPYTSSEVALRELRKTSPKARLVIMPGSDHSYRADPSARARVFSISRDWLESHLYEPSEREEGVWSRGSDGNLAAPGPSR